MRVERSVPACFQAPGKGYRARMNRVLDSTVRHIAKQSADASGRSMRSEANFRLRGCRPRPHLDSSPASFSAFFHQSPASERLMRGNRSFVAGITAASPIFSCLPPRRIARGIGSISVPPQLTGRPHVVPRLVGQHEHVPHSDRLRVVLESRRRTRQTRVLRRGDPCRRAVGRGLQAAVGEGNGGPFSDRSWSHTERGGMPPRRLSSDAECPVRGGGYLG